MQRRNPYHTTSLSLAPTKRQQQVAAGRVVWSSATLEVVSRAEAEEVRVMMHRHLQGGVGGVGEEGSGSQKKEEAEREEQDDQEEEEEVVVVVEEEVVVDARTHRARVLLLGKQGQTAACLRRMRLPCLRSTASGGTHARERKRQRE